MRGTLVKWFDKGFGFLRSDETPNEVFMHVSQVKAEVGGEPLMGDVFDFEIESDNRGRSRATAVRLVSRAPRSQRIVHTGGEI